jgi:hypothetical protein
VYYTVVEYRVLGQPPPLPPLPPPHTHTPTQPPTPGGCVCNAIEQLLCLITCMLGPSHGDERPARAFFLLEL